MKQVQEAYLTAKHNADEPPLRAELFSVDQMEHHGKILAAAHTLTKGSDKDQLLTRLADNERVLNEVCSQLIAAARANQRITPAGEWLLDNFYLITEQILIAKAHFPKGYSRELPVLGGGDSKNLPRVYDIALEVISHGDGRVDPENLNRFVASYQKTSVLKLGELWAIPIMLRLALIENLRRIGTRVAMALADRNQADFWADKMMDVAVQDPKSLILVISDMARSNPPLCTSFVAELARRLRGHSSALALPLTWIEQRLSESGQTIEHMVHAETQTQAASQVCISNTIGSLRFLGARDWREFVESMSAVESTLREDPHGTYPQMEFTTRDQYRHAVEQLARQCKESESDVARKAVELAHLAQQTIAPGLEDVHAHVGYYLIGKGRSQLERAINARLSVTQRLARLSLHFPLPLYLGSIALLTGSFSGVFVLMAQRNGLASGPLAVAALVALWGTSQLAVTLVNWAVTLLATPSALPRMDYSKGIDAPSRTLVIVPTMLTSLAGIDTLAEALEVRFLANQDPLLHFGLLTDLCDATEEIRSLDAQLVQRATECIEALNSKYSHDHGHRFFLFHRPRLWNVQEHLWMGYERKRGKLAALNRFLRHGSTQDFACIVGETEVLQGVRYVITLDTDTQLQRDCARVFVATMAHPLNRPRYDERRQRVVEGYGILQPRMAVSLPSTNRSHYARLFGSEPGVDPYTRAVSDVYQDLFGEGSFIGKGIYDVDAFELALKDRFPENRILSHDLLEGCYARAGLLSDVQLYDDYPASYHDDVSRRYRWIRGDWQNAAWLWGRVPGPDGTTRPNLLSYLSQWKVLDNLRRSLVPAALLVLVLMGWLLLDAPLTWTLLALSVLFLAPLMNAGWALVRKPKDLPLDQHVRAALQTGLRQLTQTAVTTVFLAHEAWFSLDAVLRTTARILVTRRRLLEWKASDTGTAQPPGAALSHSAQGGMGELLHTGKAMWSSSFLASAMALALLVFKPSALGVALPLLALWFAAPLLAWWISRPIAEHASQLRPEQVLFLHKLARRTWRFFQTFVTAADHWLPPDNYQEHPVEVLAHRTSPTNMGLSLLSNLAAYDFGYIPAGTLLTRTTDALATLQALERYEGHFYNWYDTLSLRPLAPRYVSSVDSGNLSGHLLTLRPGLLALIDENILSPRAFTGLADAMSNLADAMSPARGLAIVQAVNRLQYAIDDAIDAHPTTVTSARRCLEGINQACEDLAHVIRAEPALAVNDDLVVWSQAVLLQCQDLLNDLVLLVPWTLHQVLPAWLHAVPGFGPLPTVRELGTLEASLDAALAGHAHDTEALSPDVVALLAELRPQVVAAGVRARARMRGIEDLAQQAQSLSRAQYSFLYDQARHLIAVGYNVDDHRRDSGNYDLLASEARLCSFVAIAQSEIPQENWFALGRLLTMAGNAPILLSWSGSMFEYLMPMLVMPSYANTLLDQTCQAVVKRQMAYGNQHGVPWGTSESGYNAVDTALNYQYRAFGVPGLGLKRGLAEDLVMAPYACALALMVSPDAACQNLQRLASEGLYGPYGLYEAVDYTPARLPRGQTSAVVRSFMAHHQGMSLLSLAYALLDRPMQKRFESDPLFQATTLLLQERVPNTAVFQIRTPDFSDTRTTTMGPEMPMRVLSKLNTDVPEVQLLSNGRYHVMVSQAGGGYSRWKDMAVTRWREDGTRDNWGNFCYLRDLQTGEFWSTSHQPTLKKADKYEAIFSEGRAEFRRRDHDFETHTEIVVSPEDDIELRRLRITNRSRTRRTIEVTSYAEVVLTSATADAVHPAFSNLFVQTEIVRERQAILCHRRPRSEEEPQPCMFHLMAVHGATAGAPSFETDRMRFVGRTQAPEAPLALLQRGALSGSEGSVLDPVVAIRYSITLEPQETTTIDLVYGVGESREATLALMGKYGDRPLADRVFDLAWTHSWVNLQQINATESDAQLYSRLASSVLYANATQRAEAAVLMRNRRGQSALWGYGISGDLPIVLLQISSQAHIELARQLVQAHAYWRLKGLAVDLVIWNEDHAGYRQQLQDQILGMIAAGIEANFTDRPGGIFVRAAEQMSQEDRTLFLALARVCLSDTRGTLATQVNRRSPKDTAEPPALRLNAPWIRPAERPVAPPLPDNELQFFNGLGGFSPDGTEYIITTRRDQPTPAPWVNVMANERFGTVISESGSAYTWSENAHEFRYTPWGDDPVSDVSGEAIYLRDEDTGAYWSPTALPCGGPSSYRTRHGFGYSVFEHEEEGIRTNLTVYVDVDAAIKFSVLKVHNNSARPRRLSVTGYVEWVLGDLRSKSAMHVTTEIDSSSGAILARNPYSPEFADRVAFFDADGSTRGANVSMTGDRREFLGRNGSLKNPAAMGRARLSNKLGAGLDPCAAIQVPFELASGQEREIIFRLGAAGRRGNDVSAMVKHLRDPQELLTSLQAVRTYWQRTLGAVQVQTPDPALNVLVNGWLLYQTIACRLWARSGYYQSGGAFGFRDQLQDSMALVHAEPELLRSHLLRSAARQFLEGDVQHWWHPPQGRGVRTRCSDDFLWLPQATCRYVLATGDTAVLDEMAHFLEGRPVNPEDDSYYDLPVRSESAATLYEHCVRALRRSFGTGSHGLPLMGSGDWNDGMNLVGIKGRGESVWLGFFLFDTLQRFAKLAQGRGDSAFARECLDKAEALRHAIDQHGWDGQWYRRAYFDDGTPLGTASNAECQIDSISQSWSVLSGAGDRARSGLAMNAVDQRLVKRDSGLIQLLDPPFDTSDLNPGYIKGYVPGVRENGGQYTHAAIWTAMAFAASGDKQRAWECFDLINPVRHGDSPEAVAQYKVEPYVVAADVYAVAPHTGRGGWTWYTGSASWMYRLVTESLLGLVLESGQLRFMPCLPVQWPGFKAQYRFGQTHYAIEVTQTSGPVAGIEVLVDGVVKATPAVDLVDDQQDHWVGVRITTGKVGLT